MPLIDILFTLIIFFLATATFQEQERDKDIQLPKLAGQSLSSAPRPLIINVTKQGSYIVHTKTPTRYMEKAQPRSRPAPRLATPVPASLGIPSRPNEQTRRQIHEENR